MNYIINKTKLVVRSLAAVVTLGLSITNLSANEIVLPYSDYRDGWESFIMGDTTTTGEQNHDVYILESSKVYNQKFRLILNSSVELRGASFDESTGGFPATVKQILDIDNNNQFVGWPATHIATYGENQLYVLENLMFNGAVENTNNQTVTAGVLAAYGEQNDIIVDHVTSVNHSQISYQSFGHMLGWEFFNNTAVQYTTFAGGMWYGGFFWGGGFWMGGPLKHFIMENNTVEGTWGASHCIIRQWYW